MKTSYKIMTAAILACSGLATPALAVHEPVSIVDGFCVAASEPEGCLFNGNISDHNYLEVQDAYNALDPERYDAPITLRYLASTDTPDLAAIGGGYTGQDTPSGTWSIPGYLVDFYAVKAGNYFALYKLPTPVSSGSWNTDSIATQFGPDCEVCVSHLVFFGAAVPEPESWAMLIAGFGLVGAVMRRRRTLATA